MIASSYTLAAAVSSLVVVFIGMPLGRRGCILMGDLCVIIGGLLQATAFGVPQMIVGRVMCVCGFVFSHFRESANGPCRVLVSV